MADAVVKSAVRAIEVLDHFAAVRSTLSLKDICRHFKYPQSSTTALLKTLTSMGYLNYDRANRVYLPTIKVTALGEWIPSYLFRSGVALDLMRDLNYITAETINISILNDVHVNYVAVIQSTHALRFHLEEGSVALLHRTSAGWVFLAAMDDAEARALLERSIAADDEAGDGIFEAVWEQVTLTRERGYAFADNTLILGAAAIAVPLPVQIQGHTTVLGCGGASERLRENRERYLELIDGGVAAMRKVIDQEKALGAAAPSEDVAH